MPSLESLGAQRWGLRYSTVEGVVCLLQIAGGGRVRLGCGHREWWARPPRNVAWEAFPSHTGQTYETRADAEEVIANLMQERR
jgi:hypothetical protein